MAEPSNFSRREVNWALLATAISFVSIGSGSTTTAATLPSPLFDIAITGGFHHGLRAVQATLRPGMMLVLRREPDNPHDANAVAAHMPDGLMLGYVPRVANEPIARLLDDGRQVQAEILQMLAAERGEDIPNDLVFTCFTSGDPMIRLTAKGYAA